MKNKNYTNTIYSELKSARWKKKYPTMIKIIAYRYVISLEIRKYIRGSLWTTELKKAFTSVFATRLLKIKNQIPIIKNTIPKDKSTQLNVMYIKNTMKYIKFTSKIFRSLRL